MITRYVVLPMSEADGFDAPTWLVVDAWAAIDEDDFHGAYASHADADKHAATLNAAEGRA
ncbi:hypothetical protein BKA00_007451 [Actinomadura coerulea]|uniref:Uncharacterized protein n=1 Tax=Actinomadura coerulea TaxID=46159 RepID=A0A7X0G8B5_9ACTN|nr:hypothetical protein [Actinomadura coerulea]GGQ07943.1 hypothetical protein GCM10010187_25050 [Actinomadura coerulea]